MNVYPLSHQTLNFSFEQTDASEIPNEITRLFFLYCSGFHVATSCRMVCKRWAEVSRDENLWMQLFKADYPDKKIDALASSFEAEYRKVYCTELNWAQKRYHRKDISIPSPVPFTHRTFCIDGTNLYHVSNHCHIQVRDKFSGELKTVLIPDCEHDETIIRISENHIIGYFTSGPDGGTKTNIWEKKTLRLVQSTDQLCYSFTVLQNGSVVGITYPYLTRLLNYLNLEKEFVILSENPTDYLLTEKDLIFCHEKDGKITFMNQETLDVRLEIATHQPCYLAVYKDKLICGQNNGCVNLFNISDGLLLDCLMNLSTKITELDCEDDYLFVQTGDVLVIYDLTKGHNRCSINNAAFFYRVTKRLFIIALKNGNIELRDKTTGTLLFTLLPPEGQTSVSRMVVKDNLLLTGYRGKLQAWSLLTGKSLWLEGEQCFGWHLDGDRLYLSSSNKDSITVLDFSSPLKLDTN